MKAKLYLNFLGDKDDIRIQFLKAVFPNALIMYGYNQIERLPHLYKNEEQVVMVIEGEFEDIREKLRDCEIRVTLLHIKLNKQFPIEDTVDGVKIDSFWYRESDDWIATRWERENLYCCCYSGKMIKDIINNINIPLTKREKREKEEQERFRRKEEERKRKEEERLRKESNLAEWKEVLEEYLQELQKEVEECLNFLKRISL